MRTKSFLGRALVGVVLAVSASTGAFAAEFSFRNMYHAYMKLDRFYDYDDSVDDYMQTFRPQVWKNKDVLVMDEKRAETMKMMKEAVAAYDLNDPFDIVTDSTLGEYDVTAQRFGFQPFDHTTYFYVQGAFGPSAHMIKLTITNPEFISGVPIPKDKAKAFLDSRKNGYGIDRTIKLHLKVKPTRLMSDWTLGGDIVSVEVVDPKQQAVLWRNP
jgi:hypothetical protein